MVAELFVTSYGALGIGGVIAFVLGSVMLIETDVPGYDIPWTLIATVASVSRGFLPGRDRDGGAGRGGGRWSAAAKS